MVGHTHLLVMSESLSFPLWFDLH